MIHPYSHYPSRAATSDPGAIALCDGTSRLSYRELDDRATRLAHVLVAEGLAPGDRVAVVQENSIEYVETVVAIARAGGVLVPMLGALTEREHAFMVDDSGASFVVALSDRSSERAAAVAGDTTLLAFDPSRPGGLGARIEDAPTDRIAVDREPASLAQILYTSGTTGHPKGVTHSYATVSAAMGAWATLFRLTADDRLLGQLALSHFGGRAMDSAWIGGARLVILREADPESILATIEAERITMILVVPTLLRMILDHPAAAEADLSSLRVVLYAAAPAAPSLVRRALDRLGPVLYTGYGQTEAYGLNTTLTPAEHLAALEGDAQRLTSVGRECRTFGQLGIRTEDGGESAPGEVGEICLSAPWVTPGFWNRPDLDEQRLSDGWLRTGDLGRIGDDGYVYLADRKEDMIITGGFNVYPAEVEAVLSDHPAVAECAVFAVPNPKWGEAVQAAVSLRPDESATSDEILAFSKQRLARFKVPKVIDILPELPKTPVGKILRRELREPHWRGRDRDVHGAE